MVFNAKRGLMPFFCLKEISIILYVNRTTTKPEKLVELGTLVSREVRTDTAVKIDDAKDSQLVLVFVEDNALNRKVVGKAEKAVAAKDALIKFADANTIKQNKDKYFENTKLVDDSDTIQIKVAEDGFIKDDKLAIIIVRGGKKAYAAVVTVNSGAGTQDIALKTQPQSEWASDVGEMDKKLKTNDVVKFQIQRNGVASEEVTLDKI